MREFLGKCNWNYQWLHENGDTKDIISAVMAAVDDPKVQQQTKRLTSELQAKYPSPFPFCEALWRLVKEGVTYQEDIRGEQLVKDPVCTLGYAADCKSMTVMICSVLRNAGIHFKVRFTRYKLLGEFSHVYPVALLGKKEIPIDAVHHSFNKEVYYVKKKDFKRMAKIARISGLQKTRGRKIPLSGTDGELHLHLLRRQFELKQQFTNDTSTKKLLGQGMNIIDRSLVQGLHKYGRRAITGHVPNDLQFLGEVLQNAAARNRPATSFKPSAIGSTDYDPTPEQHLECVTSIITLDTYVDQDGDSCDPRQGGNYSEQYGFWINPTCHPDFDSYDPDAIGDCRLRKFYENLFNDYFEDSSPALLYSFINDENDVPNMKTSGLIKRAEQIRYLGGLSRLSGLSPSNLNAWTRNGILGVNGETPDTIITRWNTATASDHEAMIGCPPCAIIVPIVVAIVGAVTAIAQTAMQAKQKSPTETAQEDFDRYASPPTTLKQVMGPGYGDWNPNNRNGSSSGSGSNGSGSNGSGGVNNNGSSSSNMLPLALMAGSYYLYKKRN